MRIFGDNPIGWRAMSALFGSLTLVATLIWSYALLRDLGQALWACAITLFDSDRLRPGAHRHARHLPDGVLRLRAGVLHPEPERTAIAAQFVRLCDAMGVSLGLASACKLSGLFLLCGIIAVRLLIGLLKLWRVRFEDPKETDFFAPTPGRR